MHFDSQSGAGATALAFGKPMIVSGTGGLPELVVDQHNVVTPGDADALADRIVYCLKNRSILDQMARDSRAIAGRYGPGKGSLNRLLPYIKNY